MDNGYLVPANAKKGMLIFNMLRPIDAMILGIGTAITLLGLAIIGGDNTLLLILMCIPMAIAVILIIPIPNYHNTLVALQSIIRFYNSRRNYIWKGWCIYDEFKDK